MSFPASICLLFLNLLLLLFYDSNIFLENQVIFIWDEHGKLGV